LAVGGNTGGTGGAKNLAKVEKDKKHAKALKKLAKSLPKGSPPPKNAAPPNFPTKVPVRPGAPTNRYSSKPSTQAQRTHVHKERAKRSKLIEKKPNFPTNTQPLESPKKQKIEALPADAHGRRIALVKAGQVEPSIVGKVVSTAGKAAQYTSENIYHHPKLAAEVPVDLGKSLLSIPSGLIRSGLHPVEAAKLVGKDYERRYGAIYRGEKGAKQSFEKRQEKEGVTPELLDAATVATAGGSSAGRGLQKIAEAGTLGKTAAKVARAERPALQVSGEAVAQRAKGKNFLGNAVKHAVDVRRAKKTERVIKGAKKHDRTVPVVRAEAARKTQAGIPTVAPLSGKLADRAQRMSVAKHKGRAIVRQKVEQQTIDRELYKRAHKVDPYAFKYATQYGIENAKQAKEILGKHLESVKAEREKLNAPTHAERMMEEHAGVEAPKKVIPKKQDEVPHLERLIKNPEVFDHPLLQGAVRAGATSSRKVAEESPGIAPLQAMERRIAPQAKLLGIERKEGEAQTAYLARAQKEIKDSGLKPGEYYPSTKRVERQFLNRTTGGSRAMPESKRYKGALTVSGREHASLDAFANSLHQEIRRKHNWNLVNKVFEQHTIPWSRDKKFNELQDLVDEHNIDPNSVTYVDVRKIQAAKKLDQHGEFQDTQFAADTSVQQELDKAFVDPAYVAKHPEEFRDTSMAIMPREVANELRSGFKQSGPVGRSYRIAKGSASRVLLSNPVWLQFQIASNALMSATHGTGIVSALKAHYKFKEPEWKALESDIGVHKFYDDRAHLGASVNNNRFIDGWRAWQKVGAGSKLRYAAHPVREFFNLFHRGDTAQNNFFRRAVLYNDVKREAYRRMATDAGRMTAAQERIMNTLKITDPQKLMDAIVKDPHQFEEHARAVDDFMGNWTSYTSRERQLLGNVMFGGFIRFSTRLAFYTMPMRHPIMYSLALQMGRLEKDELKKIFGTDPPPWEIGNYYSQDGKAKFQAVRLNPFANALTQLGTSGGNNLVGSLPPVLGMLVNQFAKENVGQSQPWFLDSKQVDIRQPVGVEARARMMAESILQLSPFYRAVEKHGVPGVVKPLRGKQNSDSGVLFPSPRTYKRADTVARNEKLKKQQDESSWLEALTPLGQSGSADVQKSKDYAASQHKTKAKKRKGPAFDILGGPAGSHGIEILH
jgi:hypothetical protein